jgi:hypothetical protein
MQRSLLISLGVVVAAMCGMVGYLALYEDETSAKAPSEAIAAAATVTTPKAADVIGIATANAATSPLTPLSPEGQRNRQAQLAVWQSRYERAEQTYAHYRDATRYPHESRPLLEHPDQVHPFATINEDTKLRGSNGEPVKGVKLRTTQERVFASAADTVKLTVQAVDDQGAALPLAISSASAQSVAESKVLAQSIRTNISFADDGQGADSAAGDKTYSTRLSPKEQGFGSYAGTVRVLVQFTANGQQGVAQFDVVYNPEVPATWAGVREAVEGGSLNFYFKAQVKQAGRYVASARVDDANGQAFALLQFNDEVATGTREFKMQVFGALIHDKQPAFPLRVRDVEGFLLFADRYPDRALMSRQVGLVHTSARYSVANFSAAEWTSEERERYLAEYAHDAELARAQIARLAGH